MEKRVLIVAGTEGFIIKGIETKLNGIGVNSMYSAPIVKDLKAPCEAATLFLLYLDGNQGDISDTLVYIKDHCAEYDKQVIMIGEKEDYELVKAVIPESMIYHYYGRPLDMAKLLSDIEKYMSSESNFSKKKSILVVDDDVSYMSMIMDWLKDTYRVSLANSGMAAITWLAKNHADLILLDYEMPITTGPQVLEMIRGSSDFADIPVMFLTGKGDKESIMKVLSLKPVGYLLKTVSRAELRENLANYFSSHHT